MPSVRFGCVCTPNLTCTHTHTAVLFGCLNPTATLLLWGIIPMPAGFATALFVGKDLLGLVGGSRDHVSHEGHLAGAAVGGLYFLALRR